MKKRFDRNGFFDFRDGWRAKACRRIGGRMAGDVESERARGLAAKIVAPRGRRMVLRSSIEGWW